MLYSLPRLTKFPLAYTCLSFISNRPPPRLSSLHITFSGCTGAGDDGEMPLGQTWHNISGNSKKGTTQGMHTCWLQWWSGGWKDSRCIYTNNLAHGPVRAEVPSDPPLPKHPFLDRRGLIPLHVSSLTGGKSPVFGTFLQPQIREHHYIMFAAARVTTRRARRSLVATTRHAVASMVYKFGCTHA